MIVVTKGNQTEPLNNHQKFEMNEEVKGAFTVSLTSFLVPNNPGHELLEEESIISVEGYDFRIKQLKESLNRKDVVAISTFYDLVGHRQDSIYGGTRTFDQFASFVFSGTGWTYSSDVSGSMLIANFGDDNVIKLVLALCATYECEFKIMPGYHVHFAKQIGPDNDAQYRHGHNVQALSRSVDTTNLRTRITGYGGNGLVVTYTSPYADMFPDAGEADPFRDERFTVASSLTERLKQELHDYPDTSIELDSIELTDKELGERVWLIYEPMGIEFQTRILSKKTIIRGNKLITESVVIGNSVPRSTSDLLVSQKVEIDENKKETRSRFEQTNDRIVLEVDRIDDSIAALDIKADNINLSVNNRITSEVAAIDVRANQIELSVSNLSTNTNSAITQLSNNINLKIDKGGAITDINLAPGVATINADRINLNGAVMVNGHISGATYIDVSTDINLGRMIRFNDFTAIFSDGGSITLDAFNDISYQGANHYFYGTVDFSNATVIGL